MIEYDKYQKSLKHLKEQYQHYIEMDESYPDWIEDAIGLYQTMSGKAWEE